MNLLRLSGVWLLIFGWLSAGVAMGAVKPKINVSPASQSVELGAGVQFSVTVVNASAPTYQWRFNKTPIQGATQASYTIDAAALSNAGKYDVLVTAGTVVLTSRAAKLTVNLAPVSLPIGTAVEEQVMVRIFGETEPGEGSYRITSSTVLTDLEDNTGSYTYTYKRTSATKATFTVTGSFYDSDLGDRFGLVATYILTFTGVATGGERSATIAGKGAYYAPAGYTPRKISFTFNGTLSVDLP
jgi:Immunoglobulin domain